MDERENIGGFYKKEFRIYDPKQGYTFIFPLIVIKGNKEFRTSEIKIHEQGHAENDLLSQVSIKNRSKFLWLRFEDDYSRNQDRVNTLKRNYDNLQSTYARIKQDEIIAKWRPLLFKLLETTKDEIIADMGARSNLKHVNNLIKRNFVYDYIKNTFRIDPQSELYYILWNEYERIINEQIETVNYIMTIYNLFNLRERMDLFRLVLAQIPFYKWKEQMERSGFLREANLLNLIFRNGGLYKISKALEDADLSEDRSMIPKLEDFLKRHSSNSILNNLN